MLEQLRSQAILSLSSRVFSGLLKGSLVPRLSPHRREPEDKASLKVA